MKNESGQNYIKILCGYYSDVLPLFSVNRSKILDETCEIIKCGSISDKESSDLDPIWQAFQNISNYHF